MRRCACAAGLPAAPPEGRRAAWVSQPACGVGEAQGLRRRPRGRWPSAAGDRELGGGGARSLSLFSPPLSLSLSLSLPPILPPFHSPPASPLTCAAGVSVRRLQSSCGGGGRLRGIEGKVWQRHSEGANERGRGLIEKRQRKRERGDGDNEKERARDRERERGGR